MVFWAFLCFSLKFSPFFSQNSSFLIHCTVSGTFCMYLVTGLFYVFSLLHVRLHNVLSHRSICGQGCADIWGGGGG